MSTESTESNNPAVANLTGGASADRANWEIGGHDTPLDEAAELQQLVSHFDAHFPLPDFTPPWKGGAGDPTAADNYSAKLPDRLTHAAMLLLGSGVDHSMPGVAFTSGVEADYFDLPLVTEPAAATAPPASGQTPTVPVAHFSAAELAHPETWLVTLHSGGWWRGSVPSLEMQWRPEVAAAANLAGCHALDIDYPLAPQHTVAEMAAAVHAGIAYARSHGATRVIVWGYSSGGALAALCAEAADALILTFPDFHALDALPDALRAHTTLPTFWPATLLQLADADEVADTSHALDLARSATAAARSATAATRSATAATRSATSTSGEPVEFTAPGSDGPARGKHTGTGQALEVEWYPSQHRISTPAVARRRIEDVARFIIG